MDLAGAVAVVTGASSGLGRATSLRLAKGGARVALFARTRSDLDLTEAEVRGVGGVAAAVPVDLSDISAVAAAVERVVTELGPPRVLVNAAGTDAPGPAEALEVADFERVVRVNLTAPFVLAKLVFPHMRAAGGGIIVNVSSVAGRRGWANASAYCATKFGLTGLSEALAVEGAPHGIRVITIYPGAMATHWGNFDAGQRRERTPSAPEDELPPSDVADYLAWLAAAPDHMLITEAIVAPIRERGWP